MQIVSVHHSEIDTNRVDVVKGSAESELGLYSVNHKLDTQSVSVETKTEVVNNESSVKFNKSRNLWLLMLLGK